jgi:hypothetical protein
MSRVISAVAAIGCAALAIWILANVGSGETNVPTTSVVAVLLAALAALLARAARAPIPKPRVAGRYEFAWLVLVATFGALGGYGVAGTFEGVIVGVVLGTLAGALGMLAPSPWQNRSVGSSG